MTDATPLPVTAGVDGSTTALHAALWAATEAEFRGAPLRLVYVTKTPHASTDEYAEDVRHAHSSLRQAQAAVKAAGSAVTVDTAVISGPPADALVAESTGAQMMCVGSVGIGRYARSILGSTAADLAEKAHCPVAVIRPDAGGGDQAVNWIVVAVTDQPDNDDVVEQAMREAALRHLPVLALGDSSVPESLRRQLLVWRERFPDVHIYPIDNRAEVTHFLRKHDEPVLLAVIGGRHADQVAQIVGHGHSAFRHTATSALVVR